MVRSLGVATMQRANKQTARGKANKHQTNKHSVNAVLLDRAARL
jgi:hypothetical protein